MTSAALPSTVEVLNGGTSIVNGRYQVQPAHVIPNGFTLTCNKMSWDSKTMWEQLSDGITGWYEHENGSYIYRNVGDGKWWIDAPYVYLFFSNRSFCMPSTAFFDYLCVNFSPLLTFLVVVLFPFLTYTSHVTLLFFPTLNINIFNHSDGGGVYIVGGDTTAVPTENWQLLPGAKGPAPTVQWGNDTL